MAGTFPFSRLDELFFHIDQPAEPFSLQLEVRVDGHFSSEKLRAAIAAAMARHPLAQVRQQPWDERSDHYAWETVPQAAVPLKTVDCSDDAQLAAARAEHMALSVPLAEAPPFRALLAHHPQGDVLVLNVSHVAADGIGGWRLLQSILRAYAGAGDPLPEADPVETRDIGRAQRPKTLAERLQRVAALGKYLRDSATEPPARIAARFGEPGAGVGFEYLTLDAAQLDALGRARVDGATLNDVLAAALHLTVEQWNTRCKAPCRRVTMMMPMNLREDALAFELVGNHSVWLNVATTAAERRGGLRGTLAAVAAKTRELKAQRRTGIITDLLELAGVLPGWARRRLHLLMPITGNFVVDTTVLYNLGRLPPLTDPGSKAGKVVDFRFNPPARMPLGVSLGAATVGDRLLLSFRYRREQFDHIAARDFVGLYARVLEEASR